MTRNIYLYLFVFYFLFKHKCSETEKMSINCIYNPSVTADPHRPGSVGHTGLIRTETADLRHTGGCSTTFIKTHRSGGE